MKYPVRSIFRSVSEGIMYRLPSRAACERRRTPEQVIDRAQLRASPPPLLVTNITMLEYMLVRAEDQPIIDTSKRNLVGCDLCYRSAILEQTDEASRLRKCFAGRKPSTRCRVSRSADATEAKASSRY